MGNNPPVTVRWDSDAWLAHQQRSFESLAGNVVSGWRGVEMALREITGTEPQFSDPSCPFLQLLWLEVTIGRADYRTIDTYQDDTYFGLRLATERQRSDHQWDGIYRQLPLDLPTGLVRDVKVHLEQGTLAEVLISFEERTLLLVAGEAYESPEGHLDLHRFDESVLVFENPNDAQMLPWIPPRDRSRT